MIRAVAAAAGVAFAVSFAVTVAFAVAVASTPAAASAPAEGAAVRPAGAGELALDRAAVGALLDRLLPRTWSVALPGLPQAATLRRDAPRRVAFEDGALRVAIPIRLEPPGVEAELSLALRPETDPRDGAVRLRAFDAVLPPPAPSPPAGWVEALPPLTLPRTLAWRIDGPDGPVESRVAIHGVRIEERRLVVEFGLGLSALAPGPVPVTAPGAAPAP